MNENRIVMEIKDISVGFRMYGRGVSKQNLSVIRNMSLSLHEGEILAIVGASGSGKSVLAHAILGLLPSNAYMYGDVYYNGKKLDKNNRKKIIGTEILMIPQSVTYLDPLMKVGKQVRGLHGTIQQQRLAFERYGLSQAVENMYPFQLSGGMARRVLISTAIITNAKVILADEPTPGLSENLTTEIMNHFRDLANKGKSILMITHDIEAAISIADTVAVFYDGEVVDVCKSLQFKDSGQELTNPYTRALWQALPQNGFTAIDISELMGK